MRFTRWIAMLGAMVLGSLPSTGVFAAPNPLGATTPFEAGKHGFNFTNYWEGDILIDIPIVGQIDVGNSTYGLCGGMTLAALDSFQCGGTVPDLPAPPGGYPQPPASGTSMRTYIYGRQMDSMKDENAFLVRRLVSWMSKPIHTNIFGTGLHVLTDRRFKRGIAPEIDAGRPVPLCLVKTSAFEPDPSIFVRNHQVLAIGYRLHDPPDGPKHWDVDVYDPNFPDEVHTLHFHKDFRLQTRRIGHDGKLVPNYDKIGKNVTGSFRGFFDTPYAPKTPPWVNAPAVAGSIGRMGPRTVGEPPEAAEPDAGETDPLLGPPTDWSGSRGQSGEITLLDLLARLDRLEEGLARIEAAVAKIPALANQVAGGGGGGSRTAEPSNGAAPASTGSGGAVRTSGPGNRTTGKVAGGKANPGALRLPAGSGAAEAASRPFEVVPNPELKGRLGRLVVEFPEGSECSGASIKVFKAGDDQKAIAASYGKAAEELMPGRYSVNVGGKKIEGVEVQSHHDTRLRVGVLRIHAEDSTRVGVFEQEAKESICVTYGSKDVGLPSGTYEVEIAGQRMPATIEPGKVLDF